MKGIIGKKIGMTQLFLEDGQAVPVTVIQAGPCPVVQRKTQGVDGYEAIQLGYQDVKPSRINKPLTGHFQRHGAPICKVLKEFHVEDASRFEPGQVITVEVFQAGETVKVSGRSKGRGFTGVMRRHNFKGAPGSHGTHEYFRHGGSIGSTSYPGRVFRGLGMAGQHGSQSVTTRNLKVMEIRPEDHVVLVKGAVPGRNGGIVVLWGEGDYPTPPSVQSEQPDVAGQGVS
jgi:large subunit ribosomal protein L3